MANLLEQLRLMSTVVADTGELDAIKQFTPEDATTNPSLILKAVETGQYDDKLTDIIHQVSEHTTESKIEEISDRLIVAMGCEILNYVPGRVSTEVDARLSFDTEKTVAKARKLIALYKKAGIGKDRVLIKIAATWEGIRAAERLKNEGIECNLTLIFSFAQARACAEAGIYLISPFVGRILDWFRAHNTEIEYRPEEEPGVVQVKQIYNYFKQHGYQTVVMGASFRNTGEIIALYVCDRLTISPTLLNELANTVGNLNLALNNHLEQKTTPSPIQEAEFRWQMNADAMATEKLAEGIRGFAADQEKLETLLLSRLR